MTKITGAIAIGDFSRAIGKEMVKYSTAIEREIDEMNERITKEAVKELKAVSKATFTERSVRTYHKGWTVSNENVRHRSRRIIHHKTKPGLPHLLENGHAKTGGDRVSGRVHIKPIEEKLVQEYQANVENIIKKGGE